MEKTTFIDRILTKRRQLERSIFLFEENGAGIFIPSRQSLFTDEQLLAKGMFGGLSLRDLLAHLLDWETRLVTWFKEKNISGAPNPDLEWEKISPDDIDIAGEFANQPIAWIVAQFEPSLEAVISVIEPLTDEELFYPGGMPWLGTFSAVDYIDLATVRHYDWIKDLIYRWDEKPPAG